MEWTDFYQDLEQRDIADILVFDQWQLHLARKIDNLQPRTCLEGGSGCGMTSLLLKCGCKRFLLDLEPRAMRLAGKVFQHNGQEVSHTVGNLLDMPFPDGFFDLVFNAGVLEHFDFSTRVQAVQEMVRVTQTEGTLLIGLPNHYSPPYLYSYQYLIKRGEWPYPEENPIYDLSEEIEAAGVQVVQQRETVCRETAYIFLRRHQRIMFRLLNLFRVFEGYLTILTLKKQA